MKVVWLCHFANREMKEYFKTPHVNEFAPWITNLIELFKDKADIELHIVAPNVFTNSDCSFKIDGVGYHFYKRIPIPYNNRYIRKIHSFLRVEQISNFFWIKRKISNCIHNLNPDIIHLHGAENPYYSAGILPLIDGFPILLTIQGFIHNSSESSLEILKKIEIEEDILVKVQHVGIRTDEMRDIAHRINSNATLHFHDYPIAIPNVVKDNIGKDEPIDCLFFARICRDKGIEDLLAAISIVKKEIPGVSLAVIGSSNSRYLSYLKGICSNLGIEDNVQFIGFLPTQEDIYKYAFKAKMCVLPTYHDIISGTIIESLFMKLPVVAYGVGGIPELNSNEDTILLVEKCDIVQLAKSIVRLLKETDLRITLADKGYVLALERFNNKNVYADILNAYRTIIEEYRNKN